jgi:hypothetical protein
METPDRLGSGVDSPQNSVMMVVMMMVMMVIIMCLSHDGRKGDSGSKR